MNLPTAPSSGTPGGTRLIKSKSINNQINSRNKTKWAEKITTDSIMLATEWRHQRFHCWSIRFCQWHKIPLNSCIATVISQNSNSSTNLETISNLEYLVRFVQTSFDFIYSSLHWIRFTSPKRFVDFMRAHEITIHSKCNGMRGKSQSKRNEMHQIACARFSLLLN